MGKNKKNQQIRVVCAIDFGTTYSGFSLAHVNSKKIETHNDWPKSGFTVTGQFKVPTIVVYDNAEEWNVVGWGTTSAGARSRGGNRNNEKNKSVMAEYFKLHLCQGEYASKHSLPEGLDYRRAVTDYLREFKKEIEKQCVKRWPGIKFPQDIRFIVTVPTEWEPKAKYTMRDCIFEAGIIEAKYSENLEFTTEPEAAAIYCLDSLKQYKLEPGDSFLIVDCGGGTVDLTTRKILAGNKLSEVTESTGATCGSTFVDREFIRYLGTRLGISEVKMNELRVELSREFYRLIHEVFCPIKFEFTSDEKDFENFFLNIEDECGFLKPHVDPAKLDEMEENEWTIELDYQALKNMFDVAVNEIIRLIRDQLKSSKTECSAIFMVGGFSESAYLESRVKRTFSHHIDNIIVPLDPIAAVCRGAASYGLSLQNDRNHADFGVSRTIATRVLKYTYGTNVSREFEEGDPPERRVPGIGMIPYFHVLAKRGDEIDVGHRVSEVFSVFPFQTEFTSGVYYTSSYNPKWIDEDGVKLLREFHISLPLTNFHTFRPVISSLTFGTSEVKQTERPLIGGVTYNGTAMLPE